MENSIEQALYELLEISRDATLREIKTAYRKKAMQYHPDVNSDINAHKIMCQINHAYQILSNQESRIQYDKTIPDEERETTFETYEEKSTTKNYSTNKTKTRVPDYDYYYSVNFDEDEQNDFYEWITGFVDTYFLFLQKNYHINKLNDLTGELYESFNNILSNEKKNKKEKTHFYRRNQR